jgi:NodT family efflux transporter outer membrane factor (OMF) lipoprotein
MTMPFAGPARGQPSPTPRRWRAAALMTGVAALVAGCAAVGPNFQPPKPPTTDSYRQNTDVVNQGPIETEVGEKVVADWWTLFRMPQLDALMREAIANNRTLEVARARLKAAREAVGVDTGQTFADLSAGYKRQRANLGAAGFTPPPAFSFPTNPEFNLYSIGAVVSYNFDVFGGVRREREARLADAEEKARELDAAYLTLTGQVVIQDFTIGDATIHVAALEDIVANDKSDLEMVKKAFAAGGAAAVDVATIQTQLASDEAAIPPYKAKIAIARHQLAVLLGKTPSQFNAPDFDLKNGELPMKLPVAIPSELVRGRPDILQAEARLHAATARVGVATADLYPKISLTGTLNQDSLTPERIFSPLSNSYTIGPALSFPLFHSGELHAAKREAEANAQAEYATYQQTVLAAFAQVDDALQGIAYDNEAYAQLSAALDGSTAKLEMMRKGFKAGGVSALQLVDAERSWRRTRLNLSDLGRSRVVDAARLLLATATVPPGVAEAQPAKASTEKR